MSRGSSTIAELELHAYVDGQLEPGRRAEVEARLAEDPGAAARVRAYQAQNRALKGLFDPVLAERVPARLAASARGGYGRWRRRALPYIGLAASLALGVALGWHLRGAPPGRVVVTASLPRAAAMAHAVYTPEVLHPVEVAAEQEAHLVKWLTKRLGVPVRAPDLAGQGYQLVGGRLLPGAERPAAQFMYQDAGGQRLTLYLRTDLPENQETAFRYAREDGLSVFYWVEGPVGYALVGSLGRETLLGVAEAVYRNLTP